MRVVGSELCIMSQRLSQEDQELMKRIDRIYMKYPFKGSRRLVDALWDIYGVGISRKRVQKLMRVMGLRGCFSTTPTDEFTNS